MAWYKDLDSRDYFGSEIAQNLVAVGWLEKGKPFSTGKMETDVLQKLRQLRENSWTSGLTRFRGYHGCDLCRLEEGMINLFISFR